jgi:probable F420-dependent oxidoreductase
MNAFPVPEKRCQERGPLLMAEVRLGAFLPTFGGADRRSGKEIAVFARQAEALGFDSLWATDHLLHGSVFYQTPWLDPLMALGHAACATTRVRLGTSVLVMPTRHPVGLAKEIATLQALSGDRFILGAGTGWDEREFEAVGIRKPERGGRTDEALAIVRRLVAGEAVTFQGRFYRLRDVEIGPTMRSPLQVWVAGGQQLPHPKSPEPPVLSAKVLARIAAADGWIARPTATPQQIREDLDAVVSRLREAGRDLAAFTIAHENFLHFVPTEDPEVARAEQSRAFTEIMGHGRPFEYFERVYLTGTQDEVLRKIEDRIAAGVRYLMLHTLEPSTKQLELWAEHLMPRLKQISAYWLTP